uniref:Transcription initiation factor IIF subunit alpha n=1 Tax=Geospiza parvula TaxID=87175 RepID=A0A8U8BK56_GEOPR
WGDLGFGVQGLGDFRGNTPKRYNIMAFNSADRVSLSTWAQARMERDMSNKRIYAEEELPESGAGSEFHRRLREEARRKKFGIVLREFRAEDQPWLLRVNGKGGRRFRGVKKGGVTENASYYIFTQCPDGAFEAFPVRSWFNFTPLARHPPKNLGWETRNPLPGHSKSHPGFPQIFPLLGSQNPMQDPKSPTLILGRTPKSYKGNPKSHQGNPKSHPGSPQIFPLLGPQNPNSNSGQDPKIL